MMNPASVARLVATTTLALAFASCAPTYPKCKTDKHCAERNEICVQGQCQECGRDGDCKSGFICRATKCIPRPECFVDTDCAVGFKCKEDHCRPECAVTTDCATGLECKNGRCLGPDACLGDADCTEGMRCESNLCVVAPPPQPACELPTVYFAYNEYTLNSDAQRMLDGVIECLKSGALGTSTIVLSGHADERGTEEYNLHLGEKRANAVMRYLAALGVENSKMRTISFGEERPVDPGHDEAAWTRNRRVEITL